MNFGIHIHQDALGGKPLRAVRSHGVAMIEMPHYAWIKGYGLVFLSVHADGHFAVVPNMLKCAQVAVSDVKRSIRRSELQPLTQSNLALDLSIGADAAQP